MVAICDNMNIFPSKSTYSIPIILTQHICDRQAFRMAINV